MLFAPAKHRVLKPIDLDYGVEDAQFLRSMTGLFGPCMLDGNRAVPFYNGDEIFPAMLAAIAGAQRTVNFETFIYWSGDIGQTFSAALAERARAGVQVRVIMDWFGSSRMEPELIEAMRRAGCMVVRYHPLRWYKPGRFNNRTHRKLLIVDGRIGFTGGVGISDDWMGNARGPGEWRDTHYRLEGPAVAQMQAAFLDNWMETQNEVLDGADHFPKLDPVGDTKAQVFKASPDEASESLRLMYLMALSAARRSIRIMASYFVPDRLTAATLIAARRRGVSVEVIVPGRQIDVRMVRWTSRSLWGPLLEAGVVIHEFQPSMYHCKVMVVDGLWVSVGSGNFDNRSFALNDEANLNIYDARIAALETAAFEADRDRSRPITLREWSSRPLPERAVGWAGRLVKSQL